MDDKARNLILFYSIRKHNPGVMLHGLFKYLLAMRALCLHYTTSEKEKDSGSLITLRSLAAYGILFRYYRAREALLSPVIPFVILCSIKCATMFDCVRLCLYTICDEIRDCELVDCNRIIRGTIRRDPGTRDGDKNASTHTGTICHC